MRRLPTDLPLAGLALASVLALTTLAHALEPPRLSLADAALREGARVEVEARVLDVREGARARWLELADAASRMAAFAPNGPPVARGDVILAQGIVTRPERDVMLSLDDVRVVQPALARALDPGELARAPQAYDGARVLVAGEVRSGALVGDDARVRLAGEEAPRAGDVTVTGVFRYRSSDASYVLWVESWTPRS